MTFRVDYRIRFVALSIGALVTLTSCANESKSSYGDIDESEAAVALTTDYTVPIYPGSTLFESKHVVSSMPAAVECTGSFHSKDACPDISDWYSRRLRMQNWKVTGIEKQDQMCEVIATREKEECKLTAKNDGTTTTIVIFQKTPK